MGRKKVKTDSVLVYMNKKMKDELREYCEEEQLSMSDCVRLMIHHSLKELKKNKR